VENYEPLQILYGDEMDILTLKSKVKLGCTRCEKCCIYRGDIKINPLTACRISKYLNIELNEFLESYTDRLENSKLETVLKTTGELQECVLYDRECVDCGECDICDLDPMKICNNCGKCLDIRDDAVIKIDKIITEDVD